MIDKTKYITLTLFTILIWSLSACGTDDNSGGHPEVTHQRNLQARDFNPDTIVWEYDNHEGLQVHKSSDALYLSFTHHSQLPNIQFFLDIDNNPNSGVATELGADYMVENGWLYESTKLNTWGWKEIAQIPMSIDIYSRDSIKIPLSYLKNIVYPFKVNAQALNKKWLPKVFSPTNLESKSTYTP